MRIAVTGATGFIGRHVVDRLTARGDEVVSLDRDDLRDVARSTERLAGADAVIHAAGAYRAGITKAEHPAMLDANLGTTRRIMDAAATADVSRIVYLSTISAFGNTHGQVVDETYRRDLAQGYLSYYDESKWLAHLEVEARIATGAPIVIVQPGVVYGQGDHASVGQQLEAAFRGTAPYIALGDLGVSPVHVTDLASGIVAAMDRGQPGLSYVLAGPNVRFKDAMAAAARAGGRRPPWLNVPDVFLRVGATLAPDGGRWFGLEPNLREIMSSTLGVTYWASSARAAAELGYAPRGLADGFADAFGGADPAGPVRSTSG